MKKYIRKIAAFAIFLSLPSGNYLNNFPPPLHKFETTFDDHLRNKPIKCLITGSRGIRIMR